MPHHLDRLFAVEGSCGSWTHDSRAERSLRGVAPGRQGEDEEEGGTETTGGGGGGETRKGGHPSEHGERGATGTSTWLPGEDLHSQNKTPRWQPSTEEIPSQQYSTGERWPHLLLWNSWHHHCYIYMSVLLPFYIGPTELHGIYELSCSRVQSTPLLSADRCESQLPTMSWPHPFLPLAAVFTGA